MSNRYLLIAEIRKNFMGYQKFIWLTGFMLYICVILTEIYTVNNRSLILLDVDKMKSIIQNAMYGSVSMIQILVIIFQISVVFCRENMSNMFAIIKTSRFGGKDIILIKIISSYAIVVFITFLVNIINIFIMQFYFHDTSHQDIETMLLGSSLQLLGNLTMTSICLAVSSLVNSIYIGISSSLVIVFSPLFLTGGEKINVLVKVMPIYYVIIKNFQQDITGELDIFYCFLTVIINLSIIVVCIYIPFSKHGKWGNPL